MLPEDEEECEQHDPKTCMSQQAMNTLYEMRSDNMLCDATITLDDGIFNVHRVVLCSCSNYFRSRFCFDLANIARNYILKNFIEIYRKSNEIYKIGLDDFYDIINDDMLNTQREETVWDCCIRWIEYDSKNRTKYVPQLMHAVRLGLLNTRFFMEKVKDHYLVVNCDEAKPLIIETLTFLYDLDMIASRNDKMSTPALALPRLPHEVLFAIGGWSEGLPQKCIETYDTRADRWIRISAEDTSSPRAYHGTAVIGHKIYCIGGFDGVEYYNTCRVFDAVEKTWREISPMHNKRCYVSVATLNDYIYAMGGFDGQTRQSSAEKYDYRSNQWTMIASMNIQRSDASACTLNEKIYITGGFNGQECMNSAEYYDPNRNEWFLIPNMISRRSGVSCVSYKGYIYVMGGFNGLSRMNTGEKFDPIAQRWSPIKEMYHPRSNFGLEIIDDMIIAVGGFNGVATISHAECYVVEHDEWLEATDMGMVRSALTVNVVKELPNIRDYIHKDREHLIEERRQRMFPMNFQNNDNSNNSNNNVNDNDDNNNNVASAQNEINNRNYNDNRVPGIINMSNTNNRDNQRQIPVPAPRTHRGNFSQHILRNRRRT
ncbi:kelch-like protein 10 [Condylostylus longicornis]|uniref:kelch-like protein 10 n=1 Tax=Condylostylus longicornis TaxID=2530218 RepID=UPI00244DE199|nr:kelch-like protein 10 [Condylostylus longicornis]